jgi:hypothetical protein
MRSDKMFRQPFPDNPARTGYCVFDKALEDDPLVLFHATPLYNFDNIIKHGFMPGIATGKSDLKSVSFAYKSSSVIELAMQRRAGYREEYCIFAVRYRADVLSRTRGALWCIHDDSLTPPPEIIGYCIVPTNYQHV